MSKTRITLVGCGATGTLIGHAIKAVMTEVEVVGHDKERDAGRKALAAKAIDREEWNLPRACEGAAMVLIAIPQEGVELTLKTVCPDLVPGGIVCVLGGSNKENIDGGAKLAPADAGVIASTLVLHPERVTLPDGAPALDQLKDAIWTIAGRASEDQINAMAGFVSQLGARPIFVDAAERDGMALAIDVVPAALQSMLMLAVSGDAAWSERGWSAGADFARATARIMQHETLGQQLLAHRPASAHWLNQIMLQCMQLRDALNDNDGEAIAAQLELAADRRAQWIARWRKGRDTGATPIDLPQRSMLGMFIGQRNAERLGKRK
jgi:prephenate dehydrogenase